MKQKVEIFITTQVIIYVLSLITFWLSGSPFERNYETAGWFVLTIIFGIFIGGMLANQDIPEKKDRSY
jgi:energy-coupling factor transporter transmembrane protein EcfT